MLYPAAVKAREAQHVLVCGGVRAVELRDEEVEQEDDRGQGVDKDAYNVLY